MNLLGNILIFLFFSVTLYGAEHILKGKVISKVTQEPIEYAHVYIPETQLWAISDSSGLFVITGITPEAKTLQISCLGYVKTEFKLASATYNTTLLFALPSDNIGLEEIVVTAKENKHNPATSYIIDKTTLEHQHISAVTDISTLLPGGKTAYDNNLATSDGKRFEVRSASGEMGNPSFMTAVEVDGIRLNNNASLSGTQGADLRSLSVANIESVEIITGIPSVEYGDVSGGVVKVNTFKGYTPFQGALSIGPKTKTLALSKGFNLGYNRGLLNVSLERTRSVSEMSSPYTTYDRNGFTLYYSNIARRNSGSPLKYYATVSGNIGGYDSKADPDAFKDTYTKISDNSIRIGGGLDWLLNKPWLTGLEMNAFVNHSNKKQRIRTNKSSSTATPVFHGTTEGYFIATDYAVNPDAAVSLIPAGYWYEDQYCDDRPLEYNVSLKMYHNVAIGNVFNKLKVGVNFSSLGNEGTGIYYGDPLYTPTWRAYPYSDLPYMNTIAFYAEDMMTLPIGKTRMRLTAGIRQDITKVDGSGYGTVGALSPRFTMNYSLLDNPLSSSLKTLNLRAGIGSAVKLPSFAILYSAPTYSQQLTFAPGALADGTTYYAYYIMPSEQIYNANLKWQRTRQMELGIDMQIGRVAFSLNAYRNVTNNGYSVASTYNPFTYKFTDQKAIENTLIPIADRGFSIDPQSGIVTLYDKQNVYPSQVLAYTERTTYKSNSYATNTSPVLREGLEWIVDFGRIPVLSTSIRYDGSYYHYRGINETLIASMPASSQSMADGSPYKYVGHYAGSTTASNGSETKSVNSNITFTTNIPRIRLLVSLRLESTLYYQSRNLSEYRGNLRGVVLADRGDYTGTSDAIYAGDQYVAVYPEFYSSTDNPDLMIPFEEKFLWAKDNDVSLYNELAKLVAKTNTAYYFNKNRISPFFAANLTVTKELGKHFVLSFFANNFFNNLGRIKSGWNDSTSSLLGSSRIPAFNYGLSLKIKL